MADTVITVRAKLPYALRHPDCTDVSPEKLMRMAADCIEGQERLLHDRSQIMADNLNAQGALTEKYKELERQASAFRPLLRAWVDQQSRENADALYTAGLDYLDIVPITGEYD